ncbi:MAG: signal peptidase I [Treponema sp.]|nr:signal peptidase I [Treponema sp.]
MQKPNLYSKKFGLFLLVEMIFSAVYTLFTLSFKADISLLAFPLSVVFTAFFIYFGFFKVYLKKDQKYFYKTLKFVQYVPTVFLLTFIIQRAGKEGKPYWLDFICAVLWILVFIYSFVLQYYMAEKRVKKLDDFWLITCEKKKKPIGLGRLLFEIVDWVDALLQVVFLVFIFQVFTFQLYVIPSESMVPEFLVKDRVVVEKIGSGPKFPLSEVGLNDFSKYKRGDIVVIRNPHYTLDHKSEVKTVTSQLVYMLTFMAVNLNKDENGEMKADPLVKRIAGLQGEQLVMQDGVLYTRTKESDVFKPIPEKEDFACWNLNTVNNKVKSKIQNFPMDQNEYETMISFEEERRNYDLDAAAFRVNEICNNLRNYISAEKAGKFTEPNPVLHSLLNMNYELSIKVMTQEGGLEWFEKFLTSWIPEKDKIRDPYSESNFRLNVIAKVTLGNIVLKNAQMIKAGVSSINWNTDPELKGYLDLKDKVLWYVQGNEYNSIAVPGYLDMRNMPVFPANDSNGNAVYLPEGCYFMMGDNRFNSLDLRHSYEPNLKPLAPSDSLSIRYVSYMEPKYLNKKYIMGKPIYRFMPLNRAGSIKNNKRVK